MRQKKNDDSMLNTSEFTLLLLTPFVAALLLFAWPITTIVFCTVMVVGAIVSYNRK